MSNVHPLRRPGTVTREQLEKIEGLEYDLADLVAVEVMNAHDIATQTDALDMQSLNHAIKAKNNAIATATLMYKLGVYASAKRGTMPYDAGAKNYPDKEAAAAEQMVSRLTELRKKYAG